MRLVIALGGNALLKRGEPMLCENQRVNVSLPADRLPRLMLVMNLLSRTAMVLKWGCLHCKTMRIRKFRCIPWT